MSRFAAWESRNLAKFAQEATARLLEQEELIESLQADLKTAIRAYRHLIIEGANREQNNTVDSSGAS
jgi:DNA-binding transcriptional MocR family regulator